MIRRCPKIANGRGDRRVGGPADPQAEDAAADIWLI
jgi:hypothetical protein